MAHPQNVVDTSARQNVDPSTMQNSAREFVKHLKLLVSQQETLNSLERLDELPVLEAEINARGVQIAELRSKLLEVKAQCKKSLQDNLDSHDIARDQSQKQLQEGRDEIANLKQELEKKSSRLVEIEARNAEMESKLKESGLAEKKAIDELKEMDHKVKIGSSEIEKLQLQVQEKKSENSDLIRKCSKAYKAYTDLGTENKKTSKELQDIKSHMVELIDGSQAKAIFAQLDELWMEIARLVFLVFFGDLPNNEEHCLERLKSASGLDLMWSLPPGNTPQAKQTRVVAVVSCIAKALDQHMLQPSHQFPSKSGVRESLFQQARDDRMKEKLIRSFMLSLLAEKQDFNADTRIATVRDEVMKAIMGFLTSTAEQNFKTELESLVRKVSVVWAQVIRLEPAVGSFFNYRDLKSETILWNQISFTEGIVKFIEMQAGGCDKEKGFTSTPIIPTMCVWDGDTPKTVSRGVVFMGLHTTEECNKYLGPSSSTSAKPAGWVTAVTGKKLLPGRRDETEVQKRQPQTSPRQVKSENSVIEPPDSRRGYRSRKDSKITDTESTS